MPLTQAKLEDWHSGPRLLVLPPMEHLLVGECSTMFAVEKQLQHQRSVELRTAASDSEAVGPPQISVAPAPARLLSFPWATYSSIPLVCFLPINAQV